MEVVIHKMYIGLQKMSKEDLHFEKILSRELWAMLTINF